MTVALGVKAPLNLSVFSAAAGTLLLRDKSSGLPVLSDDRTTVIGWLTHRDLLNAYQSLTSTAIDHQISSWPRSAPVDP